MSNTGAPQEGAPPTVLFTVGPLLDPTGLGRILCMSSF